MEYQSFGRSGLQVSRLCFGGMLLSPNGRGPWRMPAVSDETTCVLMLDRYVKAGGNFIDTSNNYGESEIIIGNWLRKQSLHTRRKLIISSKFASPINTTPRNAAINYPNSSGTSRKHIMDAIEDSLQKLQTKYLDVYTIHYWDDATELEEVIRTLQNLIKKGFIRYYAVSNYTPVQLQKLISLCERQQWELPILVQCQYNLLCRTAEWELIGLCSSYGIGFLSWSPLAGGWLSNKYSAQNGVQLAKPPENSRMSFAESVHFSSWDLSTMGSNPKTWQILRLCADIAADLKSTVSQVAIRWVLHQEVTGCVVGPRTLAHLEDNLLALKLNLTSKHLALLNEASHSSPIYPYCSFSELTVRSPSIISATNTDTSLLLPDSSRSEKIVTQRLIDPHCFVKRISKRSAWVENLIDQKVYDLAASKNRYHLASSVSSDNSGISKSTSQTVKLVLIFGGFISYEESITTFRQIFLRLGINGIIQSFISDALALINELILHVKTELKVTWMDNNLNLSEWVRLGSFSGDYNSRPSFPVCLCLLLMNQITILLRFLQFSNITLAQLKEHCIFLSGFSVGLVTAYVVDISTNEERLYKNALAAIRLLFWLGFRGSQDFQQARLAQYAINLNKIDLNLSSSKLVSAPIQVDFKTGSIQVSGVHYRDVSKALDNFNKTNPFGCSFDICVVSQCDRVTISGFVHYVPQLIEYLQSEFPSCSLVPVALDVPSHIARYFRASVATINQDFSTGSPQFEGNSCKNKWKRTSLVQWSTGKPAEQMTFVELINSLSIKVCRWDLVSNHLAEVIKTNFSATADSSGPIIMLDLGPSMSSKNLINNNTQIQQYLAQKKILSYTIDHLPYSLMAMAQKVSERVLNDDSLISSCKENLKRSIAIVGMACRFPHATNTDEFFYNLLHQKHSIKTIHKECGNQSQIYDLKSKNLHKSNAQQLEAMKEIDLFDPEFFNLSSCDANHMDSQHRLTLEICYLALENAGYVMGEGARMSMDEQRVGVFVGCTDICSYCNKMEAQMDAYLKQRPSKAIQAGCVSYFFKFCGPSIQIDTASSTSLVCLHLAVESLLKGECDAAVVSTVLASTDPVEIIVPAADNLFSTERRALIADIDGYTCVHGISAIVIKPYKAAIGDRDCIHALIDSTVVNQSGQTQNYMSPCQAQIESLIYTALLKACIPPGAIQYIESHGSNTQEGDTIEMNAIIKMLGMNMYRSEENPLYIGNHKGFIGHCDAGASLAGLIKTVMMLQHKTIIRDNQADTMNSNVDKQQRKNVIVPQEACAWTVPHCNVPRRAMVNSCNISGSSAICVLQEAPTLTENNDDDPIEPVHLITISGKEPDSVRAYCLHFIQYLVGFETKLTADSTLSTTSRSIAELRFLRNLAYTTTARRTHFPKRVAVVASSIKELVRKLGFVVASIPEQLKRLQEALGPQFSEISNPLNQSLFLSDDLQKPIGSIANTSRSIRNRIIFVFGGQESLYLGMCRQLLSYENTWTSTFRLCSDLFATIHPTLLPQKMTLLELLEVAHRYKAGQTNGNCETIEDEQTFFSTCVCQPLLFAIQYSLARLMISWGISPSYIIGHSVGEITAACVSSAISLEDALFLVGHRARLMETTAKGAMLAINCTIDDFNDICQILHLNEGCSKEISVSAYNGPASIVVAGETIAVDKLQSHIVSNNLFLSNRLNVTHAFHTNFMTTIRSEFYAIANKIIYKTSDIPVFDTLQGELRTNFDANYWTEQLSHVVQFHAATTALRALGKKENFKPVFIELNPSTMVAQYFTESERDSEIYSLMNESRSDFEQIYSAIAKLYVHYMAPVCWSELHRTNRHATLLSLPSYAFNYCSYQSRSLRVAAVDGQENTSYSHITPIPPLYFQSPLAIDSSEIVHELPLIGTCRIRLCPSKDSFECSFPVFDRAWRNDTLSHIISSKPLIPFSLYTALTSQFASFVVEQTVTESSLDKFAMVKDMMIKTPFIWHDADSQTGTCREMSILLVYSKNNPENTGSSNIFNFMVSSSKRIGNQMDFSLEPVVHASGTVCLTSSGLNDVDAHSASFNRITAALCKDNPENSDNISYEGQEFYSLLKEFSITYVPHYQSMEKLSINNDALVSWSKQTMRADQPYLDLSDQILIHPSWLDSFMQAIVLQISLIPHLNMPMVLMFVETLVCQTQTFISPVTQTNQIRTTAGIPRSSTSSKMFFTETRVTVKNSNQVTCDIRGFDGNGNCIVIITGGILMKASSDLNDHVETGDALSQTQHVHAKTKNDEYVNVTSKNSHDSSITSENSYGVIQQMVIEILSDSLEMDSTMFDFDETFANMGVDSLLSIEIRGKLQNTLKNIRLPPTILFDHSSVSALTSFILSLEPALTEINEESKDLVKANNHISLEKIETYTIQAPAFLGSISELNRNGKEHVNGILSETEVRTSLIQLISESLEIDAIEIDDDNSFTAIGVDSLLSIEIRSKIQATFRLNLSASLIFDYPTLKELAPFIHSQLTAHHSTTDTKENSVDI